jgi:hypothetical protein
MNHCNWAVEALRSVARVGRATLSTVVSRPTARVARTSAINVHQRAVPVVCSVVLSVITSPSESFYLLIVALTWK